MRYKELFGGSGVGGGDDVPFEIDTGKIDSDYMNSRFEKFLKILTQDDVDEAEMRKTLDDLHKSFARLTQEEQKYANIFLHDVESGNARMERVKLSGITSLNINPRQRTTKSTVFHDSWG